MKEFEFISALEKSSLNKNKYISDDVACIYNNLLISKDILVENIHFLPTTPLKHIIHKLFTCNISDIVAMGGVSKYVLLGLALKDRSYLDSIIPLIEKECQIYNVELIGGDTTSSNINMFSLTIIGEKGKNIIYRSGAEAGDIIFISRLTGKCKLSLEKQLKKYNHKIDEYYHYEVMAEDKLGAYLGNVSSVTSMTDISDSLSIDLYNIAEKSNKKAIIEYDKIDLSELDYYNVDSLEYFLSSGEEFALLFTISKNMADKIKADIFLKLNINIVPIGRIEKGRGLYLEKNNKLSEITPIGYEHFQ